MTNIDELFGIKPKKEKDKPINDKASAKNKNNTTLTQWLNSINFEKTNIMDENNVKSYPQYIINACLYKHRDIIYYIDALNTLNINNKMHYDFLLESIPSKKRWAPFSKKQKNIEDVELVKKYFNVSYNRALKYFDKLSVEDIEILRKIFDEGGLK